MGAWIETALHVEVALPSVSHPVWVRGLKRIAIEVSLICSMSHPVWVRGLKQIHNTVKARRPMSHPVWVRGLKQSFAFADRADEGRTPCGCVD